MSPAARCQLLFRLHEKVEERERNRVGERTQVTGLSPVGNPLKPGETESRLEET